MNAVMDVVAGELGEEPLLIWVDGGFPDLFSLPGLPWPTAVWSTRYLELSSFTRVLLVDDAISNMRRDLCRRAALTLIAEISLREGAADVAAKCAVGANLGRSWFVSDSNVMDDLEAMPISEVYVAVWFFGLAHEFGHHCDAEKFAIDPLSDEAILSFLRSGFDNIAAAPQLPFSFDTVLDQIRQQPGHPLHPRHLRGEVVADLFAAEVVLETLPGLMARAGAGRPHSLRIIAELLLAETQIGFIERCRGFAHLLQHRDNRALWQAHLLQPAAFHVRMVWLQSYLSSTIASMSATASTASPSTLRRWESVVSDVAASFTQSMAALESGLADAMRFALDDDMPVAAMIDELRVQRDEDKTGGTLLGFETRAFRELAASRQVSSVWLDAVVDALTPTRP
ncbi:hypothetical protein [Streptomyces sp. NPDC053542]|uniref:hypothetical protein n=1 Tax=Streptomyces sp. NPDC053542 TaxID=3365710 RepID=UPI0037CE9E21